MGLLDRLLGRSTDSEEGDGGGEVEEIPDISDEFTVSEAKRGWVDIEYGGEMYHVRRTRSADGEYMAAYRDGIQGGEDHEPGRVFLVHGDDLAFTTEIDRPNACAVTNDGTLAVVDWGLDWSQDLTGTVHVFDADGNSVLSHEFDANLEPVAITPDGAYVATSTLDPDRSTYIFDVEAGRLALKHHTPEGPVTDLRFVDGEEWLLELRAPARDPERITLDGEPA